MGLIPSEHEAAKKKSTKFIDLLLFIIIVFVFLFTASKLIPHFLADFHSEIDNHQIKYIFDLFSFKIIAIGLLATFLWIIILFIIYKFSSFILLNLIYEKGLKYFRRKIFLGKELEHLKSVNNHKIKERFLMIIAAAILLYIIASTTASNFSNTINERIYAFTKPIIFVAVILFSVDNFLLFGHVYKNIRQFKMSFLKKFTIYRIIIGFVLILIIIIIINLYIPGVISAFNLSLDISIDFISSEISYLETYLSDILNKTESENIISKLKDPYLEAIMDTKSEFSKGNLNYPFSALVVFVGLIFFSTSIIFPHFFIWGRKKTTIILILLVITYFLSEFMVNLLRIDEIFAGKPEAIFIVYLVLVITMKIAFDEFEKYFSEKKLI